MAYQITSESYGRRLPKITATADSTDDLSTLGTDWAEGSTCVISDTTYKLDKVKGWVDPNSGGGGGGGGGLVINSVTSGSRVTLDKTWEEINAVFSAAKPCVVKWGTAEDSVHYVVMACEHTSDSASYGVTVWNGFSALSMTTNDADGYPSYSFE